MNKVNALVAGLVLLGLHSMAVGKNSTASEEKPPKLYSGVSIMPDINMPKTPSHVHKNKPIPKEYLIPSIDLDLSADNMDGYNLTLLVKNYRMLPPNVIEAKGQPKKQPLKGHAHLFINGVKVGRIYGKYTHIPKKYFQRTINQLTVFLNGDDHNFWTSNKQRILSTLFIKPNLEQFIVHRFAPFSGLKK